MWLVHVSSLLTIVRAIQSIIAMLDNFNKLFSDAVLIIGQIQIYFRSCALTGDSSRTISCLDT